MDRDFKLFDKSLSFYTIPGLYGSGESHWQTRWELLYGFKRVEQENWNTPNYLQWKKKFVSEIDRDTNGRKIVLIAHSLGCYLVAKTLPVVRKKIAGILFVAPPDLNTLTQDLSSFVFENSYSLKIPGYLIYSENDPYAQETFSKKFGHSLGLQTVSLGMCGHINSDSNIGNWEGGISYLEKLVVAL